MAGRLSLAACLLLPYLLHSNLIHFNVHVAYRNRRHTARHTLLALLILLTRFWNNGSNIQGSALPCVLCVSVIVIESEAMARISPSIKL